MLSKRKSIFSKRKRTAWIALLCCASALLAFLPSQIRADQSGKKAATLSRIPFQYRQYAMALGQRFCKPGKERISARGTLTHFSDAQEQDEPVQIIRQSPSKIRLDQNGRITVFDRSKTGQNVPVSQNAANTVQVLLEDSAEGFLDLLNDCIAKRHLGSGFRLEGAKVSDPGVDMILMLYPDAFQPQNSIQKSYWFDSRTKLLGVVSYASPAGAVVHVVIDDYRDVDGEKLPFRIERWEDNKLTMRLALDSAVFSAAAEDGIFGGN
jgi:hypothetical protein